MASLYCTNNLSSCDITKVSDQHLPGVRDRPQPSQEEQGHVPVINNIVVSYGNACSGVAISTKAIKDLPVTFPFVEDIPMVARSLFARRGFE